MYAKSKLNFLPTAVSALGLLALASRWGLYRTAVDGRGLLVSGHPLELLLWGLTLAAAVLTLAAVRKLDGSPRYDHNFGPSHLSSAGCWLLAAGILTAVLGQGPRFALLDQAHFLLGLAAAAGLVLAGVSRLRGQVPFFLCHGLACAFFGIHMVTRYRIWSGDPQIQNHVFNLLACVGLTLFGYYQAAFDVGMGARRMQLATGLLGGFSCLAALGHTEHPLLYLAGAAWAFTNLCSLSPRPRVEGEVQP